MPIQITPQVPITKFLVKSDETFGIDPKDTEGTSIVVKPASEGDRVRVESYNSRVEQFIDPENNLVVRKDFVWYLSEIYKVFVVLVDCNITDGNGAKLLTDPAKKSFTVFRESFWDRLPTVVADEIIELVYEVNPQWDPKNRIGSEST